MEWRFEPFRSSARHRLGDALAAGFRAQVAQILRCDVEAVDVALWYVDKYRRTLRLLGRHPQPGGGHDGYEPFSGAGHTHVVSGTGSFYYLPKFWRSSRVVTVRRMDDRATWVVDLCEPGVKVARVVSYVMAPAADEPQRSEVARCFAAHRASVTALLEARWAPQATFREAGRPDDLAADLLHAAIASEEAQEFGIGLAMLALSEGQAREDILRLNPDWTLARRFEALSRGAAYVANPGRRFVETLGAIEAAPGVLHGVRVVARPTVRTAECPPIFEGWEQATSQVDLRLASPAPRNARRPSPWQLTLRFNLTTDQSPNTLVANLQTISDLPGLRLLMDLVWDLLDRGDSVVADDLLQSTSRRFLEALSQDEHDRTAGLAGLDNTRHAIRLIQDELTLAQQPEYERLGEFLKADVEAIRRAIQGKNVVVVTFWATPCVVSLDAIGQPGRPPIDAVGTWDPREPLDGTRPVFQQLRGGQKPGPPWSSFDRREVYALARLVRHLMHHVNGELDPPLSIVHDRATPDAAEGRWRVVRTLGVTHLLWTEAAERKWSPESPIATLAFWTSAERRGEREVRLGHLLLTSLDGKTLRNRRKRTLELGGRRFPGALGTSTSAYSRWVLDDSFLWPYAVAAVDRTALYRHDHHVAAHGGLVPFAGEMPDRPCAVRLKAVREEGQVTEEFARLSAWIDGRAVPHPAQVEAFGRNLFRDLEPLPWEEQALRQRLTPYVRATEWICTPRRMRDRAPLVLNEPSVGAQTRARSLLLVPLRPARSRPPIGFLALLNSGAHNAELPLFGQDSPERAWALEFVGRAEAKYQHGLSESEQLAPVHEPEPGPPMLRVWDDRIEVVYGTRIAWEHRGGQNFVRAIQAAVAHGLQRESPVSLLLMDLEEARAKLAWRGPKSQRTPAGAWSDLYRKMAKAGVSHANVIEMETSSVAKTPSTFTARCDVEDKLSDERRRALRAEYARV